MLPKLSLWLDEILDLKLVRDNSLPNLLRSIPHNGGAVPLGYLSQSATIHLLGYSSLSGRLPSLLFSALACTGIFVLGRQLNLQFPILGVLLFSLSPLQFRYALEARPYSQALALSIWTTVVFLSLLERLNFARVCLYCLLTLAGLYTQPYSVFVPLAHFVWLALKLRQRKLVLLAVIGLSITVAILGFLPWYFYAKSLWINSIKSAHFVAGIGLKTPLLMMRELVGAGYGGTTLLLCAAVFGLKNNKVSGESKFLLLLYLIVPVVLILVGDLFFSYFFAIRQMIFVLTPLSLLAALGVESLVLRRHLRAAMVLSFLLISTFTFYDIRFLVRPRENWLAASVILQNLNRFGTCLLFVPENSVDLYQFFAPSISECQCKNGIKQLHSVALSISPYDSGQQNEVQRTMLDAGFTKKAVYNQNGPRIEVYKRE